MHPTPESGSGPPTRIGDSLPEVLRSIADGIPVDAAVAEKRERERTEIQERESRRRALEELTKAVGERYRDVTLVNFNVSSEIQAVALARLREYAADLAQNVKSGRGVVLSGPPGTGKDHLMMALLKLAIADHGVNVGWENGLELFGAFRDRIGEDSREATFVRQLAAPQILAISDPLPPWGKLTEFQASTLFRIIDRRYRDRKGTWLTLNAATSKEASERMGAALIDRLRERALVIYCSWPSYRGTA